MRIWYPGKFVLFGLLLLLATRLPAATYTAPEDGPNAAPSPETATSNDTMRAYLQLQEQLHATQLTIERTRQETEAATQKNADTFTQQLQAMEQSLSAQRTRESHFMVYVLGAFAVLSFLAIVITAYFQWRTVNRLADFTSALPSARAFEPAPTAGALGFGDGSLVASGAVEQSNGRLLGAIERLEKRIHELEHAATPALNNPSIETISAETIHEANGHSSNGHAPEVLAPPLELNNDLDKATRVRLLLDKGQSLLNEDKADPAIACLDEVLSLDSGNAEALVKKGAALEKLRKLQEAIECYDRAIAADGSMTIAYLYKGGIYNRMERFGEAVECYEQALRTQEKRSAA